MFALIKDNIKQDTDSLDLTLFKELLELQFEYYLRCDDAKTENYKFYKVIAKNPNKFYDMFVNEGQKAEVSLTFTINMLAPIKQTMKELELFNSSVKTLLKLNAMTTLNSDEIKSSRMSALLVFCMEMAGNKKSWLNKIANWKKCLQVYDWHHHDKLTKTDISKKLGVYNENDKPNSLKEVRLLLAEAERLVQSVNEGSFPL